MSFDFDLVLNPTKEQQEATKQFIKQIRDNAKKNKDCGYCVHAILRDEYDMGHFIGKVPYCSILKELRVGPDVNGQQCLFWKLKEEVT